jgi:pyruvate/2-oxoglutarate dehydrogenase complex dihydrolipoamide acyltransferase (E2) component
MKMEIPVPAPAASKLTSILVKLDDVVAEGQVLAILETRAGVVPNAACLIKHHSTGFGACRCNVISCEREQHRAAG